MSSAEAIRQFTLTEFENQEILAYEYIYYTGSKCKNKVKGHPIKMIQSDSATSATLI